MTTTKYTTYKLRAECPADAMHIRSVLSPWLLHWKEEQSVIAQDSRLFRMADTDVDFSIVEGGPELEQLRWLIGAIKDCHVAAETVERAENYTGERHFDHERELLEQRPSNEVLAAVARAMKASQQGQEVAAARTRDVMALLESEMRFPTKSEARPMSERGGPGWMLVVEHPSTGLTAIRRVNAPRNVRNWESMKSKAVKARMTALQG